MSDTSVYSGDESDNPFEKRKLKKHRWWLRSPSTSSGFRSPARQRSHSRDPSMSSSPGRHFFSRPTRNLLNSPPPAVLSSPSLNRSFSRSPSPFNHYVGLGTPSPSRQSSKTPSPSRSPSPFYSKSPQSCFIRSPSPNQTMMTRSKTKHEQAAGSRNENCESSDNGSKGVDSKVQDKNQIRNLKRKLLVIENERDVVKKSRDSLQEDKDSLNNYLNFIKKDRNAMKKDRDLIREDRDAIAINRNAVKLEFALLHHKYSTLTYKLREHVECPVCFDVPTSGPVYTCPNGHFVCPKCKDQKCPTCRGNMSNGKSLLAVTVIENIDHECSNDVCDVTLPLADLKLHLQCCPHRSVLCPAPAELCGKKLPLSKVYDHILKECAGSYNRVGNNNAKNNGQFPKHFRYPSPALMGLNAYLKGYVFSWHNQHFYLSFERFLGYTVLSLQLFGAAEECKEYEVTIAVHKTDDEDMKGKHIQKFTGEPLPMETDQKARRHNGLFVGTMQLEKIEVDKKIGIMLDIKKTPL